jgi:hypothetical protein
MLFAADGLLKADGKGVAAAQRSLAHPLAKAQSS